MSAGYREGLAGGNGALFRLPLLVPHCAKRTHITPVRAAIAARPAYECCLRFPVPGWHIMLRFVSSVTGSVLVLVLAADATTSAATATFDSDPDGPFVASDNTADRQATGDIALASQSRCHCRHAWEREPPLGA